MVEALGAQHDPLAGVEVGGGDVQLSAAPQLAEIVGAAGLAQHLVQVGLDARAGVQPGGQRLGEPEQEVEHGHLPRVGDHLAGHRREVQRQADALAHKLGEVQAQQVVEVDVAEGLGLFGGGDAHHLLGGDAVGAERRDERPGGGADVHVEVVDGGVHREQVERAQRPDLVHPPGEAPAAEHQGRLARPPAPPARRPFQLDNAPHTTLYCRAACPGA